MFRTWVSLVAFYVALKTGGAVLVPVVASHGVMIVVVTALFFLLWPVGMHIGPRYFREFHSAVPAGLRDSGFFGAMVAYFGLGFIAVSVYLVATRHLSIALLFAVLGIWLIASMFGFGSDERNKREA
jgi:hypothetical protein